MKTCLATFAFFTSIACWSGSALAESWHCLAWPGSDTSDTHEFFGPSRHNSRMFALRQCERAHGRGNCSVDCHRDHGGGGGDDDDDDDHDDD
ncbi:hypothetical protein [Polyangium sp. 6x1]|uniref:hypothetical protein n=1 Tax=Polyangium sp. 6x1 TaxID=3042689 RepID=UPI002482A18B|nr:hypothetical protein [Polyangium sp. 6x1]MDI1443580.1 hypothetical protein [Polyangium sp. 6x1]